MISEREPSRRRAGPGSRGASIIRLQPCPIPAIGDRVELLDMPDDPSPIAIGSKGTVDWLNLENDQVGVAWDDGQRLILIVGCDAWRIVRE